LAIRAEEVADLHHHVHEALQASSKERTHSAALRRQSSLLCEHSNTVVRANSLCQATARELCRKALRLLAQCRASRRSFYLEGVIDDEPVLALLSEGELFADDLLIQRARLVVALGDSFNYPGQSAMPATVEGAGVEVMLTLIRACDRAQVISVGPSWAARV
jgi:hypothetical protein